MQTMTLEEYRATLQAQRLPLAHLAMTCPMCGTVQSASDLIRAGAGKTFEEVERYLGFSCVGRWTGAGSPGSMKGVSPGKDRKGEVLGCNWTLGGLFRTHKLEVVTEDGEHHPRFVPAAPEVAQEHARKDALEQWAVYHNAPDLDVPYAARRWMVLAHCPDPVATEELVGGQTLEEVHAQLPRGLVRLEPHPDDNPTLVEVWT